ncbi:PD-(D/E)XK nuclease family protein [Teredinibacter haidensis]|uniref:PD-(D/E)XK nuclease family protein n=1 Tax=Teredinibacter haidensis TaxID=2731755 RepID=UPI000948B406|nr:PD-(D/E)XK nuclease family protein [Teredinibacter haidensis]
MSSAIEESLILTANERQQRYLLQQYITHTRLPVSVAPSIASLERWFQEIWLELQDSCFPNTDKRLMSDQEELFLWDELLNDPTFRQQLLELGISIESLIHSRPLVEQLKQARSLIVHWGIPTNQLSLANDQETQFLLACIERLNAKLQSNRWLVKDDAIQLLKAAADQSAIRIEGEIRLHGFAELSPLWRDTLSLVSTQGIKDVSNKPDLHTGIPVQAFSSFSEEVEAAAQWCKALLPELKENEQIAVVVTNLSDVHQRVSSLFNRVFDPAYVCGNERDAAAVPFDISVSSSLIEEPIIGSLFELFSFSEFQLEASRLQKLNLSSFWGNGLSETRLLAQSALTQLLTHKVTLSLYIDTLQKADTRAADTEASVTATNTADSEYLIRFISTLKQKTKSQTFVEWKALLPKLLEAAGWPGNRTLNSREYQATQTFLEVLSTSDRYAVLLEHKKPINLTQFMSLLQWLCEKTSFHMQKLDCPIQILGLMEGAGIQFKHCRVISLTESNFPSAPQPNSLLPYGLQKQVKTPRSTSERELEYARKLLHSYENASENLIFSYHQKNDNDEACSPSPLLSMAISDQLSELPERNVVDTHILQMVEKDINADVVDTSYGPPLTPGDTIAGGAYHLQLFIANPFYAFANYRLGIQAEQQPCYGIPAFVRGSILHQILAAFWGLYPSKASAENVSAQERLCTFEKEFDRAVSAQVKRHNLNLNADLIALTKEQLCNIALNAVVADCERPPFKVAAVEAPISVNIAQYRYSLRVDRIDIINDKQLVIDYKTGKPSVSHLQKKPILDPQLPLYLFAGDPVNMAGISYFELNARRCSYSGISDTELSIPGISTAAQLNRYQLPAQWDDALAWWKEQLEFYTQQLASGYTACINHNPSLLRHYEHILPAAHDEPSKQKDSK